MYLLFCSKYQLPVLYTIAICRLLAAEKNRYSPLLFEFHYTGLSIQFATIEIGCLGLRHWQMFLESEKNC